MTVTKTDPLLPPIVPGDYRDQLGSFFNDAWSWVGTHWLHIFIATGIAVAIVLLLRVARHWGVTLCRRGDGVRNWYSIFGRAVGKTGNFFMIMAAARLVVGYAQAPAVIGTTVTFLFTIAVVFQAAVWIREIIFGVIENRTLGDGSEALNSALGIIRLLVTVALFAIALVVVLSNVGVNVTGLVAGLGVGGIAIGLAAQGIFADLFAALAILFDRPFRLGDTISYDKGAGSGVVEGIGLKSTRIRAPTGELRIIGNRKLLDYDILNAAQRVHNRFKFDFTLGYDTPPELVEGIPAMLREVIEAQGHKLMHGGLNGFEPSGLRYDVEYESQGLDFPAETRDKVAAAILRKFKERGVTFAYPTNVTLLAPETRTPAPGDTQH